MTKIGGSNNKKYIDHAWHYGTDYKTRARTFQGIADAMAEQWSIGNIREYKNSFLLII